MRFKLSRISIFVIMLMMTISITSADYVNTGPGVQNLTPNEEDNAIRGTFIPYGGTGEEVVIPTGTWVTIGFGVASGIGAAEPSCDALVESQIEFLQDFTIEAYIDGIKIENFYTPGEYDVAEFSYTEEGDCFGTTRYHYFIPPLSQGMHTYAFQIYYGSSLIIDSFTQITVTARM